MTLLSEILEQPEKVNHLLETQRATIETIANEIKNRKVKYIYLAARGTSDNAGRYANYLLGAVNRLPLALATPSLFTGYQQPPRLEGALVIGVSQSGQSPDIVSVLEEGKQQDCLTLAITNEPNSPLAKASSHVVNISAGEEKAVAATKTYTTELMAIAMLSSALSGNPESWKELSKVQGWMKEALKVNEKITMVAQRYRYIERTVVLGRGYNYCTAFEWALKLKELTYLLAEPYSFADFQHGPIAMVDKGFPVMVVSPAGALTAASLEMIKALRAEQQAELVIISNDGATLDCARSPIPIPTGIPEWLTPLVSILPAQLFAYHLTLAKGNDSEQPRSIHKVTETR